ncbi:MAG: hypothetical protein QGH37_25160 [Candidatus Poribacteria bacterium]|jgi:hypothetical protein|nr:hypothetical protein [Candidatus Poribacteria bacterium]MDP6962279.1 hypothetical protein [Dehalococcoidia bacterium]
MREHQTISPENMPEIKAASNTNDATEKAASPPPTLNEWSNLSQGQSQALPKDTA